METPPNPDQLRLRWHHYTLPENVIPLPRPAPETEHDDFIDGLGNGCEIIEFPTKDIPPDIAA